MNYQEYLKVRELYVNNKDMCENLLNIKVSNLYLMIDRFFDALGTDILSEEDYYNKVEKISGIVDTSFIKYALGIELPTDDKIYLIEFYEICLKYQILYLKDPLTYKNVKEYINVLSAILYLFQQIPDNYPKKPEGNFYYESNDDCNIKVEVPNFFIYRYHPFYFEPTEKDNKSLNYELACVYRFAGCGDELAIREYYENAAYVYRENFQSVFSHILAALSALHDLSDYYDRYFIAKECIDYQLFKKLFVSFETQREVLANSTDNQLKMIYDTADCKEISELIERIKQRIQ